MTYFEDNANFYPAIYATGDFDIPQGWSPVAVSRAASTQMFNTMPNRWNPIAQPVPMVSPWTNPFAQNNYGSVDLATQLYLTQANGHTRQLPPHLYSSELAPEVPTLSPAPSNFLLGNWGNNRNVSTAGTTHQNVATQYRFLPFANHRAPAMERTHAGPSAPTPPRIPSVRPFTKQPSRRDSKKTAGAANDQKSTGENKVSKAARGHGKQRKYRTLMQADKIKLTSWARKRKGARRPSSFNTALAAALEMIKMTRGVVNQEPRLFTTGTEETKPVSKRGMQERLRRRTERELFLELSRYYPLAVGLWTCPRLLCEVVRDLETLPTLQRIGPRALASSAVSLPLTACNKRWLQSPKRLM